MTIRDDKLRFSKIYEDQSDVLFRFCHVRVSDRERALDITQETLTRLWSFMAEGKPIENPRALIFRIARNLIIDWYRKSKSLSLEGLSQEDGKDFDPADERAQRDVELGAETRAALDMVESLSDQYREVIYFRYVEDLSPSEIGKILGLSPNVVSVRLTRGLDALRKLMDIET